MLREIIIIMFTIYLSTNDLAAQAPAKLRQIVIAEVLQVENYTYLRAAGKDTLWLAVPRRVVQAGDTLYFSGGAEMCNFTSKELNRTFESILFVSKIGDSPEAVSFKGLKRMPHGSRNTTVARQQESIEPLDDGVTLAQIFENREQFKGKEVKIRARVVKFNKNIMGKNWAHIQDGSRGNGKYDLLVTTAEELEKEQIYVLQGRIVLDKDFGAGYQYAELMENAKMIK